MCHYSFQIHVETMAYSDLMYTKYILYYIDRTSLIYKDFAF